MMIIAVVVVMVVVVVVVGVVAICIDSVVYKRFEPGIGQRVGHTLCRF